MNVIPGPSQILSISDSLFDSNFANTGGALYLVNGIENITLWTSWKSWATVFNCTFRNNYATPPNQQGYHKDIIYGKYLGN